MVVSDFLAWTLNSLTEIDVKCHDHSATISRYLSLSISLEGRGKPMVVYFFEPGSD